MVQSTETVQRPSPQSPPSPPAELQQQEEGFMEKLSSLTREVVSAAQKDEESMQIGRVQYSEGSAGRLRHLVAQSEEMLRKSREFLEEAD